jgi:hypothetical protein
MANLKLTAEEAAARLEQLGAETIANFQRDCDRLTKELLEGLSHAGGLKTGADICIADADAAVLFTDVHVEPYAHSCIRLEVNSLSWFQDRIKIPGGDYIAVILLKKKTTSTESR